MIENTFGDTDYHLRRVTKPAAGVVNSTEIPGSR